jgi:hypothetical protein
VLFEGQIEVFLVGQLFATSPGLTLYYISWNPSTNQLQKYSILGRISSLRFEISFFFSQQIYSFCHQNPSVIMDLERDVLLARLVFSTEDDQNEGIEPRVVRMNDAKLNFPDIFDPDINTLQIYGVKVLNLRRSTTTVFDNAAKVVQHSVEVGRALTFDLGLSQIPKLLEANVR